MGNLWKYIIMSLGILLAAIVVAAAYTEGHKPASGGFIEYHPDAAGDQMFTACITFD